MTTTAKIAIVTSAFDAAHADHMRAHSALARARRTDVVRSAQVIADLTREEARTRSLLDDAAAAFEAATGYPHYLMAR